MVKMNILQIDFQSFVEWLSWSDGNEQDGGGE